MIEALTLDVLKEAVTGTAAAFRCRTQLQPAGGEGDKVFPPTYAGAVYATEMRRLPGREEPVECVLLDSVQSQANRMEEALQQAVDDERLKIPVIEVDFEGSETQLLQPINSRVTSLTVPHRLADAILRDSAVVEEGENSGKLFRDSTYAASWRGTSPANASPIYELCPTALLFGFWGSPEKPGGLGAKFQRCVVSEIVGIDAVISESRQGLRQDPLGIVKRAQVVLREDGAWEVAREEKKGGTRPSEINHGPILFGPTHGGVTVKSAEQMVVLSLPALRRLQFGVNGGSPRREINDAGRTVLAALGLCAAALAAEKGFDLRSRCLLWPTEPQIWEILDKPGAEPKKVTLTSEAAIQLLHEAAEYAEKVGLAWRKEPLVLKPSDQLMQLVKKSQELAAAQGAEAEGDV